MKIQIVTLVFLCVFLAGSGQPRAAEVHPAGSAPDEPSQPRLADQGKLAQRTEAGPVVQVWLTRGDESVKLQQQPSVQFQPGTSAISLRVRVNEDVRYQQMDGFGAAMTEASAWLIGRRLDSYQREALMRQLFSRSEGIGISFVRVPIGGSDFVLAPYTYDDLPEGQRDLDLAYFSIEHDREYILPALRQALAINPQVKFLGSPWTAPAWMKQSYTLYGSQLSALYYQTYANYLRKFVQAYEAEGVPIYAMTMQNEPRYVNDTYPSMYMRSSEQALFVKKHLGPTLQNAGLSPKLLVWDHNWDDPTYPMDIFADSEANPFVSGSAWHCYSGNPSAQSIVHDVYPDKDIYFTECTGREASPQFAKNLVKYMHTLFIGAVRNWAKSVVLWNLALDEEHGPHIGTWNDCRGVVTIREDGAIEYEVEYYVLGHMGKFVAPGAYRIDTEVTGSPAEAVAFMNPDETLSLVVLNPDTASHDFEVQWNGQFFTYTLPAQSVATFTWTENSRIAGRVTGSNGMPVDPVTLWATGGLSATTNITGQYGLADLMAGTYTLTPTLSAFVFVPPTQTVTVPPDALNQNFIMLPSPISITLPMSGSTNAPTRLMYWDTQGLTTTLEFPAGAVDRATTVLVTPTVALPPAGFAFAGHAFDLAVFQDGARVPEFVFGAPVTVTISYNDDDARLVSDKGQITLWAWIGDAWQVAAQTCGQAVSHHRLGSSTALSASVCRAGRFGVFGPTHQIYLPILATLYQPLPLAHLHAPTTESSSGMLARDD